MVGSVDVGLGIKASQLNTVTGESYSCSSNEIAVTPSSPDEMSTGLGRNASFGMWDLEHETLTATQLWLLSCFSLLLFALR